MKIDPVPAQEARIGQVSNTSRIVLTLLTCYLDGFIRNQKLRREISGFHCGEYYYDDDDDDDCLLEC
jgi:hypothetical protein